MQTSIAGAASEPQQTSLSTRAARNLAYVERVWEPPIGGGEAASVSVARR